MSSYIEKALRTESISGAKERIGKCLDSFNTLVTVLNVITNEIDALKKYIYYGKESYSIDINKLNLDLNISDEHLRLLHAGLGMLTEAEEFLTPIVNSILKGKTLDTVNLKEEIGDMLWYQAIACDVLGTTFVVEQDRNIAKLAKRYPEKFTEDLAINRDTKAEREVLEDYLTIQAVRFDYITLKTTLLMSNLMLVDFKQLPSDINPDTLIGLTIKQAEQLIQG